MQYFHSNLVALRHMSCGRSAVGQFVCDRSAQAFQMWTSRHGECPQHTKSDTSRLTMHAALQARRHGCGWMNAFGEVMARWGARVGYSGGPF